MRDYSKIQSHLARTGRSWNWPGKLPPKKKPVPTKWDKRNPGVWDDCMEALGFGYSDTFRWCATETPTETMFGWCAIVRLEEDGKFYLSLTVDTTESEQDSPWIYPVTGFNTPLEAAQAATSMFSGLRGTP
jgi:hypothetical protein